MSFKNQDPSDLLHLIVTSSFVVLCNLNIGGEEER